MIFTPVKPMLLTMGKEVKNNPNHIYDIKWDGWRILIHKEGSRIEAYTRHGNRVTEQFPELREVTNHIKSDKAILDCEGVVLRNGVSVFDDFQYRGRISNKDKIKSAMETHPVTFIAFDVLATDETLINEPLIKRKNMLKEIINPSDTLVITPYVIGDGEELYQLTKERKLEGMVEKPINSLYHLDTRSSEWLKHKHFKQAKTVIMGYKENPFTMIVGSTFHNEEMKLLPVWSLGLNLKKNMPFVKLLKEL